MENNLVENNVFENKIGQKKKTFTMFDASLACIIFVLLNLLFTIFYSDYISSYKSKKISELFCSYTNEFLLSKDDSYYNGKYKQFLKKTEKESLSEYFYSDEKLAKKYKSYLSFYESFVSEGYTFTSDNAEVEFLPLYDSSKTGLSDHYKSHIYNDLANFITGETEEIKSVDGVSDGLVENGDFYDNSEQYYRLVVCLNTLSISGNSIRVFLYFSQFLVEALFGVASILLVKIRKIDIFKASGMDKKVNLKIVGYGFLIAVASIILFSNLTYSFIDFLGIFGYQSSSSSIKIDSFGVYLVYVLTTCITPAVCEELLFRGTILSGLKEKGAKFAIILSAIIFMLMHGSPDQTIHQLIIGMLLGFIFFKSGNLWLGAIIHFFNNFISVTEIYIVQSFISDSTTESATEVTEIVTQTSIFSFFVSFIVACIVASLGYHIVMYLANRMIAESDRINNNSKTGEEMSNNMVTATVNGENIASALSFETATESEFDIDKNDYVVDAKEYEVGGKSSEGNLTNDNSTDGSVSELLGGTNDKVVADTANLQEDKQTRILTKLFFTVSIGYLVVEWLLTLFSGLL